MNNNRGSKTLKKDRKRSFVMTKKQKKKMQQLQQKQDLELKELEKKVKKIQIMTFFKTVPILISETLLKSIVSNIENLTKTEVKKENKKTIKLDENIIIKKWDYEKEGKLKKKQSNKKDTKSQKVIPEIEVIPPPEVVEEDKKQEINEEKLEQLKNKKIIQNYEEKLKEKRTELKDLASSFPNTKSGDEYYKKAEEIYKQLNLILQKLEELERKIQIDVDHYDDAYVAYLINLYTKGFEQGKIAEDLKDSELYILISKKLGELEKEKDKIQKILKEISEKKNKEIPEESEEIKNEEEQDTFDYSKESEEYNQFQQEQNQILLEKEENYKKAQTEYEKVKTQVEALKKECDSLKKMITKRSLIKPTIRNAKMISVAALTSIFFMKLILKNRGFKKTKKILKRREYQKEIENNVGDITAAASLINQTFGQIESLIEQIKYYMSIYPQVEFSSLLIELESIKRILEERQYEIDQIKNKQSSYENENSKVYIK